MIPHSANHMRKNVLCREYSPDVLMDTRPRRWGKPRFTIFGAEDDVNMESQMR